MELMPKSEHEEAAQLAAGIAASWASLRRQAPDDKRAPRDPALDQASIVIDLCSDDAVEDDLQGRRSSAPMAAHSDGCVLPKVPRMFRMPLRGGSFDTNVGIADAQLQSLSSSSRHRPRSRSRDQNPHKENSKRSANEARPASAGICLGVQLPSLGSAVFDAPDEHFRRHLDEHGYAVMRGILGEKHKCREFLDEFWSAMAHVVPGTDPSRRSTWRFPKGFRGIITSSGLPQADFAWMVRSARRFRWAFEQIFQTQDLVVSLDAVVCESDVPKNKLESWLHKDQRPDCTLLSVQAMYTFFCSGPEDAGTCVVPGSHRRTYDWERGAWRDFIKAPASCGLEAVKPHVPPDSASQMRARRRGSWAAVNCSSWRAPCGHAAAVMGTEHGTKRRADDHETGSPLPSRLGVAVAYAPRARRSESTRCKKEAVYMSGGCSTHWPCDRFSVKPPPKSFQNVPGAQKLPLPPAHPERLALL